MGKEILLAFETIYDGEPFRSGVGFHLELLAEAAMCCQKLDEASAFLDRAIGILNVCFGPEHPYIANTTLGLKQEIERRRKNASEVKK